MPSYWAPRELGKWEVWKRGLDIVGGPSVYGINPRKGRLRKDPRIIWYTRQWPTRAPQGPWQQPHWQGSQNGGVLLRVFGRIEGWSPKVNAPEKVWNIYTCMVAMCILQHGICLWVLITGKWKKYHRGGLQVIRWIPHGKHILQAVPCLSCWYIHLRRSCRHTPTCIVHYRQMVTSRDVWYLAWTGQRSQEPQYPNPSGILLGTPRQNTNSFTHTNRVILWLHSDASNS